MTHGWKLELSRPRPGPRLGLGEQLRDQWSRPREGRRSEGATCAVCAVWVATRAYVRMTGAKAEREDATSAREVREAAAWGAPCVGTRRGNPAGYLSLRASGADCTRPRVSRRLLSGGRQRGRGGRDDRRQAAGRDEVRGFGRTCAAAKRRRTSLRARAGRQVEGDDGGHGLRAVSRSRGRSAASTGGREEQAVQLTGSGLY